MTIFWAFTEKEISEISFEYILMHVNQTKCPLNIHIEGNKNCVKNEDIKLLRFITIFGLANIKVS